MHGNANAIIIAVYTQIFLRVQYATNKPKKNKLHPVPPLITSTRKQDNIAYAKEPKLTTANFIEKLLIKNGALADEREWRRFLTTNLEPEQDDQLWYDNTKFSETELKAIYLGLETIPEELTTLSSF